MKKLLFALLSISLVNGICEINAAKPLQGRLKTIDAKLQKKKAKPVGSAARDEGPAIADQELINFLKELSTEINERTVELNKYYADKLGVFFTWGLLKSASPKIESEEEKSKVDDLVKRLDDYLQLLK